VRTRYNELWVEQLQTNRKLNPPWSSRGQSNLLGLFSSHGTWYWQSYLGRISEDANTPVHTTLRFERLDFAIVRVIRAFRLVEAKEVCGSTSSRTLLPGRFRLSARHLSSLMRARARVWIASHVRCSMPCTARPGVLLLLLLFIQSTNQSQS
jgi:hypothetical protein